MSLRCSLPSEGRWVGSTVSSAGIGIMLFGLLLSGPRPLAGQADDLSVRLGAAGGTHTSFQLQIRVGEPFTIPYSYVRVGFRAGGQSCEDSLPPHCVLPGDGALEVAGGVSYIFAPLSSLTPHLSVGAGGVSWEGTDLLLEAELGFSVAEFFRFGIRWETIDVSPRATDQVVVQGKHLDLVGFYIGVGLGE